MDTEHDEDPQFHLISIRKTHAGAMNLSQKSKDESIPFLHTRHLSSIFASIQVITILAKTTFRKRRKKKGAYCFAYPFLLRYLNSYPLLRYFCNCFYDGPFAILHAKPSRSNPVVEPIDCRQQALG